MRINQNISAMNTYSRLTAANNAKTNSLAKLSSGLRINKAGDDAAGLAISEKMRGQVGGLKQAIRNAQDGISLIQTAEGALNETHSILNRMRELAVQAANGTNTDDDRGEIQKEINQLVEEISRIADTTQFNNQNLLDGEFATRFHIGANNGQGMDLKIGGMDAVALGLAENATGEDATAAVITGNDISEILSTNINLGTITVNGQEVTLTNVKDLDGSGEIQLILKH
ncbi:MAG: flagellin [Tissierellaceae bacterium]